MSKFKDCSYEELLDYVENYPRDLKVVIESLAEPPLKAWYDFDTGRLVACCKYFPDHKYYTEREKDYIKHSNGNCTSRWEILNG